MTVAIEAVELGAVTIWLTTLADGAPNEPTTNAAQTKQTVRPRVLQLHMKANLC
jgi:hypothetical protein